MLPERQLHTGIPHNIIEHMAADNDRPVFGGCERKVVLAPNVEPLRGRNQIQRFFEEFAKLQPTFLPLDSFRVEDSGDLVVDAGQYSLKFTPPGASEAMNYHGNSVFSADNRTVR